VTKGSRLATSLSCTVVGAGVAVLGSTTTWYRAVAPRHDITSSAGTIHVSGAVKTYSPGDLGSALPPIAIIALVLAVLAYLVGPRARAALISIVIAAEISVIGLALALRFRVSVEGGSKIETGAGRAVALIGAIVAIASGVAALPVARTVRRVGMPESGPKEDG